MRDCREKPRENHTRFSSKKNTEVRLVLQVAMGSAVSSRKCCHPEQHNLFYFNVRRKMQANISTSTNVMWGKSIVLVLLQGVLSSRESSWSSISKTKLQFSSQQVRKKLFYAAIQIKPSHRNKAPNVSPVLGRSLTCIFKGKSSPKPFPPSVNWN